MISVAGGARRLRSGREAFSDAVVDFRGSDPRRRSIDALPVVRERRSRGEPILLRLRGPDRFALDDAHEDPSARARFRRTPWIWIWPKAKRLSGDVLFALPESSRR